MLPQTAPYLINTIKNWPSVDLQLRVWFWADYCESGFLPSSEGMPDLVAALVRSLSCHILLVGRRTMKRFQIAWQKSKNIYVQISNVKICFDLLEIWNICCTDFLLLLILQFYIISLYTESSFLWLVDPHKQKVSTAGWWDYNYIYI